MIGPDTNVLLRLVETSELAQRARADALVRAQGERGCFVNPIVLSELTWTLARTYKQSRDDIADRLEFILEVANLDEAEPALHRYRQGAADFADYFLAEINRPPGASPPPPSIPTRGKSGDLFSAVPAIL